MEADPLSALVAKRDEMMARIDAAQKQVREMVSDLDSLEAAIRIFDPDKTLSPRLVAPQKLARNGETARIILGVLDRRTEPTTSADLTRFVMIEQGVDVTNPRAAFLMGRRIAACLRSMSGRGVVRCVSHKRGEQSTWEVVR